MRYYICLLILVLSSCYSSDPKVIFEERTGLSVRDSISNIVETDGYEFNEGEYSIVFKTTDSQIKSWVDDRPPWENNKWHRGQIPHGIGIAVKFNFPEGTGSSTDDRGITRYEIGDENLIKLLNDTTNYYSYVEDCCPKDKDLRFHDGRLLILQPRTKMIYYAVWDF